MISLPGLCLTTGRFADAKKILSVFAKSVSMGMLPNRFQDNHEPPEYNNVDGTLWYFIAIYLYLEKTGDQEFVLVEILPVLKEIIEWHLNGTRFNIHMDSDGLLYAGEKGQQLTWMDARIGDWVVTPRMGKPVEIQALWYNAQKIFEKLLSLNGEVIESKIVHDRAEYTKTGFLEKFWNQNGEYLFDNINENGQPDGSIRPNQIFSISLPFPLLEGDKAVSVFNIVSSQLYTPVGLRSLSPEDSRYHGRYEGNVFQRDSVYHEGTVWAWLLGPYVEAGIKIFGDSYRQEASDIIQRFSYHLNEAGIGTVSEIFDGDAPHHPRGCIAQAWSVAEILRVVKLIRL
jgi:predicted glycogen debranching enzyme